MSKGTPQAFNSTTLQSDKKNSDPFLSGFHNTFMELPSFFTQGKDPEKLFRWKFVDCDIRDTAGQSVFSMKRVKTPESWSSLATEIAAAKYFRKSGVPGKKYENSILQMVLRVVSSIEASGLRQKYFKNSKQAKVFGQELTYILLSQRACFNSPVWFNCGLREAYGIRSRSAQWAWNFKTKKVENVGDAYLRPQVSACFIQSIDDNLESIFDLLKTEAKLFKFGSGSGTNFSHLRSKNENLEGGGTSSGLISFLEVFDRGAGSIKSGGTTRRAAKMVCLDVDHPEISEFIDWKVKEEKKAQALSQAGYGSDFESEAYKTVSGQNSNNSVRVSAAFMKAVVEDADWKLLARRSKKTVQTLKAKKLWRQMAHSAWMCADPGLQFDSTIQKWHTCKKSGPIRASNPCSEFMFLDDSACNLASLNLTKFLNEDGSLDLEGFRHTTRVVFLAQEILVDHAGYPTSKIAQNSHDFRPLGIGFAGLGALLMQMGVAYDSDEGRSWGGALSALLTGEAYRVSAEIARTKGAFRGYKLNQKSVLHVLREHARAAKKLPSFLPKELSYGIQKTWSEVLTMAKVSGVRNSQVSVMAPTGTIGLVMDSDTTGIEPEFSLIKHKKLAGGGDLQIFSQSFPLGLRRLGYSPEEIDRIAAHLQVTGTLHGASDLKNEHRKIFDTAMDISPFGHLQMMAAIQPFVSGAISKTVNLPSECQPEDIEKIYFEAWKLGLKSVAVYRDGSKQSQPLTKASPEQQMPTLKCYECGAPTEFAGGCFRCVNCGSVIGCA